MKRIFRILQVAGVALVLSSGVRAQTKPVTVKVKTVVPIVDREIFLGNPEIAGGQLSPDGRFISFLKPYKGVLNIYVKKTR